MHNIKQISQKIFNFSIDISLLKKQCLFLQNSNFYFKILPKFEILFKEFYECTISNQIFKANRLSNIKNFSARNNLRDLSIELNGWLNIDKPLGYSSAKVVAIIKKLTKAKKVGHGGTLDPLASGVLPICFNKATKTTEKMMSFNKEYIFDITFGESRATGDAEGEIISKSSKIPTKEEIINILPNFIGNIKQKPPIFSALKINGKRAYKLAREGKEIDLPEREVKVYKLELLNTDPTNSTAKFSVKCGKGFYVRSIGNDISKALNTEGYISYLRRTSVGIFNEINIYTLKDIENLLNNSERSISLNLIQI